MKILVVDDEKKITDFIKLGLKEEGFIVDVSFDGEDGYFLAKTQKYDLIILDINLPSLDGLSICKKLREENNVTPVLFLSVRNSVSDKVRGFDLGADDYLTKPFAFEELLARVRTLIRKRNDLKTSTLKVADLELDLLTHKVTRNGQEIFLSGKEYALLEYLMRNTGNVVTRVMIFEKVWEYNFVTQTNVIDVFINNLRNKIDRDYNTKLIKTIRGRGYILKD